MSQEIGPPRHPDNLWPNKPPKESIAELLRACRWEVAGDQFEGGYKAADYLFEELIERLGVDLARSIFRRVADEMVDIVDEQNSIALLTRYYLWRDKKTGKRKPNVQQLAQQIVAEHDAFNKSPERNGAPQRQTNQSTIEKQITRLRDGKSDGGLGLSDLFARHRPKKKSGLKMGATKKRYASKRKIAQR
jgi:hypothetical protein